MTSLSKGGTGKSTLSTILTLALSLVGKQVLLIDLGEEGSSSRFLLGNPSPPYLRDIVSGKTKVEEAIGLYSLKIPIKKGFKQHHIEVNFYMIPNLGQLDSGLDSNFISSLKVFSKYFDITILDLPAFQGGKYLPIINSSDLVLLVVEPGSKQIAPVAKRVIKKKTVVVLNKYVKTIGSKLAYDYIVSLYNPLDVVVLPFDPALAIISSRNVSRILTYLNKDTQEGILTLIRFIGD